MKYLYISVISLFILVSGHVDAQSSHIREGHHIDTLSAFLSKHLSIRLRMSPDGVYRNDTTTNLYRQYFGQNNFALLSDSDVHAIDYNPDYYRLFVPLTYYYAPIADLSNVKYKVPDFSDQSYTDKSILPYDSLEFTSIDRANKIVDNTLMNLYVKDYRMVSTTEDYIMSRKVFQAYTPTIPQKTHVINLFRPDPIVEDVGQASLKINRPNWWIYSGSSSLQFTQNYISKNWYKGGESTNTFLGYLALKANYNDREKVQWDNIFEAKLGITSSPSDTCHKFLINADLLRFYSKIGIQASKRWYYTFTGEFNTQMTNSYKKNSNTMVASFLAPANLIFTIGMDYKVKTKNLDLSILLSPGAYNLRYVGNSKVDETTYGLKKGDDFMHIIGSKFTSTWTWKMASSMTWTSRLYYFTNYSKVEAEWENTFNFILNKYLSTQLFVHGRFDDGVKPTSGHSYFQLKEFLSFGLNYTW
jgi:hypothetical protein